MKKSMVMVKKISFLVVLCSVLLCCGCGKKDLTQDEVTWSKHAFLLEDEDVFFACVPDDGAYVLSNYGGGYAVGLEMVTGYFRVKEGANSDYAENYSFFFIDKQSGSFDGELSIERNMKWEDYMFADGQMGKQAVPDTYDADESAGDAVFYSEHIVSADEKYKLLPCGMTNPQYAGKFYESLIFQNGKIGLPQTQDLGKRDKVRFHARLESLLWLDVTVPEGITFHTSNTNGHWLYLELDESGANRVGIVYDEEWTEMSYDFYLLEEKMLTDQTYEETALYGMEHRIYEGRDVNRYLFSFIYHKPIYVEIRVPEDDEQMLKAALDIVRSIKFR